VVLLTFKSLNLNFSKRKGFDQILIKFSLLILKYYIILSNVADYYLVNFRFCLRTTWKINYTIYRPFTEANNLIMNIYFRYIYILNYGLLKTKTRNILLTYVFVRELKSSYGIFFTLNEKN